MKRGPTILVALIVVVVLLLYAFAFQVRFTETAVVTRFERPVEREVTTGLNFRRLPWPIERVHKYDKRLRSFETQFTQLSTEDQKTLTVAAFSAWRIADAGRFLMAVGREEAAADKIGDLLKNAVSKVLKRHPLDALINIDPAKTRFRAIEDEILACISADALRSYGIEVTTVGIARLGLPEKNTQAVADRMKADRKKESDRLTAEGEAEARKLTETARAVATKITERARSYAKSIEGEGERLAAGYYGVFREYPELASELKKWETLTRVFSSGETTIVLEADQAFPPFELLQPPPVASGMPSAADHQRVAPVRRDKTGAADDPPPLGGDSDAGSN